MIIDLYIIKKTKKGLCNIIVGICHVWNVEQPDGGLKGDPKTAMTLPSQAKINVHAIKTLKTLDYR